MVSSEDCAVWCCLCWELCWLYDVSSFEKEFKVLAKLAYGILPFCISEFHTKASLDWNVLLVENVVAFKPFSMIFTALPPWYVFPLLF